MKDLFETPDLIPENIKSVINTFDESVDSYVELRRLVNEVEELGYTFDFYLNAEPYGLRPVGVDLNELEGWGDI
jgi:hypothetical protein